MKGLLYTGYIYIYDNYRIYTLPWDSIWTWLIAAIGYDLGYYWVHRAAHGEKSFLKNGPTPASFIIYFRSFQTNIISNFTPTTK